MAITLRYAAAFLAAVLCTSVLSSLMSSQSVISSLQELGVDIPFSSRVVMTFVDLKILQSLLPVVAACFLIGFIVASVCNHFIINNRTAWFILAGFCSLVCALLLLSFVFQLMPIAGARTPLGLTIQGLTGAVGAYLFSKLSLVPKK